MSKYGLISRWTASIPGHQHHRLASTLAQIPPKPPTPPPSQSKRLTLSNRRIIITGASRGIGAAIATRFAADGASCTLIGRQRASLVDVASSLRQEPGDERHWSHVHGVRVGDVGSRAFWEGLRLEASSGDGDEKRRGVLEEVDVLINAAGVTHRSLLMRMSEEEAEVVMRTNLMGTMWACRSVLKGMARRKTGCIINVASLLGVKGGHGSTVYAASKAGIIGLTRSLAAEVGPLGIRVNAILPGYIDTKMTEDMNPEARAHAVNSIPLQRFGTVDEIADAAVFLANNAYASNCVLNLDGGLSAT